MLRGGGGASFLSLDLATWEMCHGTSSDLAPALIALKAEVMIMSPNGERKVPLQEFFLGPNHYTESILKTDEYLTEIYVPTQNERTRQVFLKERIRHSADFALSSVAAVARISGEICKDIRLSWEELLRFAT